MKKTDILIDRIVWVIEIILSSCMAGVTIYGAVELKHAVISTLLGVASMVWISFAINDSVKLHKHIMLYKEDSDGPEDTTD